MDIDKAWDEFRTQSEGFKKASIQEQLDTLASAINEMRVDTKRTADMVPQIMGDNSAIDAANAEAEAGAAMPGNPDMMGGMGEEDMNAEQEMMPPEGGDDMGTPDMSGAEAGPAPEGPVPGAEDMGAPTMGPGIESPMGGAGAEEDDYMSDEDIDALLAELYGSPEEQGAEASDVPMEGVENPTIPASGGAGLAEAANNLMAALKQAAHEAIDNNDINRVVELSQIEQQISQTLSGAGVGGTLTEPDMTAGPAPVPEEAVPEMIPTDDVGAPDVSELDVEEEESEPAPAAEALMEEESDDDEEDDDEDDEEDDDTESTKKSMTADCNDDDPESFEKDGEGMVGGDVGGDAGEGMAEGTMDEGIGGVVKSSDYIPPTPSFRDMMLGRIDMVSFMKGDAEGYIDEAEIYSEPEVDCDYIDGGKSSFMKADDRIATARSIFDMPMHRSGQKDPDSIATAGEAQEALNHTGSQDPESISTADKIIDVKKSAEDIGEISASSGTKDPNSIASAGSAQEALSHKGTQDPESIATADKAVDMGTGNNSEGTKESIDVSIEKAAKPQTFSVNAIRRALLASGMNKNAVDKIIADMVRPEGQSALESFDGKGGDEEWHADPGSPEVKAAPASFADDDDGWDWGNGPKEEAPAPTPAQPNILPMPVSLNQAHKMAYDRMKAKETEKNTKRAQEIADARKEHEALFGPPGAEPGDINPATPSEFKMPNVTSGSDTGPRSHANMTEADVAGYYNNGSDDDTIEDLQRMYVGKSQQQGKHMMTLQEMFAIAKSDADRPGLASAMGTGFEKPDLNRITKSARPVVKMGRGVDPMKVIENDLEEWNIYKARSKF